jgi:hypothetical protein
VPGRYPRSFTPTSSVDALEADSDSVRQCLLYDFNAQRRDSVRIIVQCSSSVGRRIHPQLKSWRERAEAADGAEQSIQRAAEWVKW